MSNYRDILLSLLKRAPIAVLFLLIGILILFRAGGDLLQAFAMSLLGCASIIVAAIILAFPLARLIAESSGNLFWPGTQFFRPQPVYGIPQSKRAKGMYEEAIAGFDKIAQDYPDEVKPYIEMIDITIVNLKDPDRASAIYERGLSLLKKDEDREALARMYGAIRTRLNARPSN
jgi:tetratricopeptide (TPR) repeat protein